MNTLRLKFAFQRALLCALIAIPVTGFSATVEQCWGVANYVKKGLPNRIDSVTVITGVTCLPARTVNAKNEVVYVAQIELPSRRLVGANIDKLRPEVLNTWCTEPNMKKLLRVYDVKYKYFSLDGKFIGNLSLSIKDCY